VIKVLSVMTIRVFCAAPSGPVFVVGLSGESWQQTHEIHLLRNLGHPSFLSWKEVVDL